MVPDKEEVGDVSTRGQKGAENAQRFFLLHLIDLEFSMAKKVLGGREGLSTNTKAFFLAPYHIHIIMATPFLYDGWVG